MCFVVLRFNENPQQNCPENINEKDINKTNYKHLCCCDLKKNGAEAEHIPTCLNYVPEDKHDNYREHVCGNEQN